MPAPRLRLAPVTGAAVRVRAFRPVRGRCAGRVQEELSEHPGYHRTGKRGAAGHTYLQRASDELPTRRAQADPSAVVGIDSFFPAVPRARTDTDHFWQGCRVEGIVPVIVARGGDEDQTGVPQPTHLRVQDLVVGITAQADVDQACRCGVILAAEIVDMQQRLYDVARAEVAVQVDRLGRAAGALPLDDTAHLRPMRVEGVLCVHHEDNHLLALWTLRWPARLHRSARAADLGIPKSPVRASRAGGNHGTVDDRPPVPFVREVRLSHACMRHRAG